MNSLCRFRNILGEPGKGAHSFRIPVPFTRNTSLALVDLLGTALLALGFNVWLNKDSTSTSQWLSSWFLLFLIFWGIGILVHVMFCVKTPITQALSGQL